jgi:hypothetical protein
MKDCEKAIKEPRTKVAVQIVPCANKIAQEKQNVEVMNHESQDDPCAGKIALTIESEGSKLTKADAGRLIEITEEIFVTAKIIPSDINSLPTVDITVSEKSAAKLAKVDVGFVQNNY